MSIDNARLAAEKFASITKDEIAVYLLEVSNGTMVEGERKIFIEFRIKTEESILRKLKRGNMHVTSRGKVFINDFVGIRVVVFHIGLVERTAAAIQSWAAERGLNLMEISDRFSSPGIGGYRSVHLDYQFDSPELFGLEDKHGIEIQVTTYLQQFHSQLSHDALYKHDVMEEFAQRTDVLRLISDQLGYIDRSVAGLFVRK
jgi:ppGpp synthetase/RelA/SpoT-type nucleotidyltranferase